MVVAVEPVAAVAVAAGWVAVAVAAGWAAVTVAVAVL